MILIPSDFEQTLRLTIFKKNVGMPRVKHSQERLEIIDQLLYRYKKIENRKKFTELVNRSLPHDQQITEYSLDKDIAELRNLIDDESVTLKHNKTQGYFYSDSEYSLFKKRLNDDDKVMLILAENLFQTFKETSLKKKFKELVDKVVSSGGPSRFWKDISSLNFIQLEGGYSSPGTKYLPDLIQYIYEQKAIQVKYGPEASTKHLSPYVLKQNRGRWYLVAYDHSKTGIDSIKIYSLDRIKQLTDSKKDYYKDPTFSAEEYFKYSLGIWHRYDARPIKVKLEFTGERLIDALIDAPIHKTQKVLEHKGNKLAIELEVYDTIELDSLILGYGNKVKVITPKHLKERIQNSK